MNFERLLEIVGDEAVFETGLLLAGPICPDAVRQQLTRWVAGGRLWQLRRGVYALAPPYQKARPHPYLVANRLVQASYVSCQSALAHYDLIPEWTPVVTSVTTLRPGRWSTPLGDYTYQHIATRHFTGYRLLDLGGGQRAFVATPEKALLDLIYLTPGGHTPAYLAELRLQNLDQLDQAALGRLAEEMGQPRLRRAAAELARLAATDAEGWETL